jgi:hypothetical protein
MRAVALLADGVAARAILPDQRFTLGGQIFLGRLGDKSLQSYDEAGGNWGQ